MNLTAVLNVSKADKKKLKPGDYVLDMVGAARDLSSGNIMVVFKIGSEKHDESK